MQPDRHFAGHEPFCEIKMQAIAIAAADPDLPPDSKAALVYIVTAFSHHQTGWAHPSLETIAAALGKSVDTAKRVMARPELARYLRVVEKGRCRGRATVYAPTSEWISAASERRQRERETREKVVSIRQGLVDKGGQICPPTDPKGGHICTPSAEGTAAERGANLPEKGGQICPPNRDQELRSATAAAAEDLQVIWPAGKFGSWSKATAAIGATLGDGVDADTFVAAARLYLAAKSGESAECRGKVMTVERFVSDEWRAFRPRRPSPVAPPPHGSATQDDKRREWGAAIMAGKPQSPSVVDEPVMRWMLEEGVVTADALHRVQHVGAGDLRDLGFPITDELFAGIAAE